MPRLSKIFVRGCRLAPLCPGTVAFFSPFQLSLAPASPSHLHLSTAPALPQPLRLQLRPAHTPVSPFRRHRAGNDTTVSINLTFCKAFRAHQRSSGKAKVFRETHASCIAELGNHNGFILLIQLGSDDNLKHGPKGFLVDLSKRSWMQKWSGILSLMFNSWKVQWAAEKKSVEDVRVLGRGWRQAALGWKPDQTLCLSE
ncbi:unnamed protein product [Leuciscus chuanchicus]